MGLIGFCEPMDMDVGPQHQMIEDCRNSLDDDGDGLIDLNDPDCECEILNPESLIPNPSFEESTCCPTNRSMLNCAVDWIQASEPTTDLIHPCGWTGWDIHFPPTPFPDGEAIMGFANGRGFGSAFEDNWKEYAGACLLSPLKANTTYRFEFYIGFSGTQGSPPIDISFFGTTDCDFLPFGVGDADFGCPTNGPNWQLLGAREVSGGGGPEWLKTEITITPNEDIHAIAIGPPCEPSSVNSTTYYFFDNLILADLRSFEFTIEEVNHPCAEDFTLQVPEEEGVTYQWYKDGIALVGEESALLSMDYGEGDYQVRVESDGDCVLTQPFTHVVPVITDTTFVTLCNDEVLEFGEQLLADPGTFSEMFVSQDNCDSIVSLTLDVLPELEEMVTAKIFEGETFDGVESRRFDRPGTYSVELTNRFGCDSLVILELEFYNVYFPNVFAPNYSESNGHFFISGNEDLTEIRRLDIYDRWGMLVYSGRDEFQNNSQGWDGRYNGNIVEEGVYTYISTLEMDDGVVRQFAGSVLLIK